MVNDASVGERRTIHTSQSWDVALWKNGPTCIVNATTLQLFGLHSDNTVKRTTYTCRLVMAGTNASHAESVLNMPREDRACRQCVDIPCTRKPLLPCHSCRMDSLPSLGDALVCVWRSKYLKESRFTLDKTLLLSVLLYHVLFDPICCLIIS